MSVPGALDGYDGSKRCPVWVAANVVRGDRVMLECLPRSIRVSALVNLGLNTNQSACYRQIALSDERGSVQVPRLTDHPFWSERVHSVGHPPEHEFNRIRQPVLDGPYKSGIDDIRQLPRYFQQRGRLREAARENPMEVASPRYEYLFARVARDEVLQSFEIGALSTGGLQKLSEMIGARR